MNIKQLGAQTLVYGIGHVISRGITFLLLPIYTNIFSLEDYGIISLIFTFLGFLNVILHYGLDSSLLKHYVPANIKEKKVILSNVYISFLITTTIFIVIMILFKNHISSIFFGIDLPQITLFVSGILFFDVLWAIHLLILRAEENPFLFSVINLFNVISSLGLNIFFVVYLHLGIYGVLLSNIITSGSIFFITLPIIINRFSIKTISLKKWKKLMKFGIPFLFSGIFSMILELSDRYILRIYTNIETVGLYSAGYKIGMIMMLVVMGFNMAWQPYFLKKNIDEKKYINKITILVISFLVYLWILLIFWSKDLLGIQIFNYTIFGKIYWESIKIIPIIALGYIFHAIYLLQLPGVYLLGKSGWIAVVRGIGATLNILLNFLFIPQYGIIGAASATCLSFILMAILFYFINKKIFPILYNWKKLGIIIFTAAFILFIYINLNFNLMMKLIISIFYPIILILLGVVKLKNLRLLFIV